MLCSHATESRCGRIDKAMKIGSRFWKYVEKTESCWLWTGYKNHLGYGRMTVTVAPKQYKLMATHRLSWKMHRGPIPEGKVVMHDCDNPACVNPDHLLLGTQLDNMRDMKAKGRDNRRKRWTFTTVAGQ